MRDDLALAEAATRLGRNTELVRLWVASGRLAGRKRGYMWFVAPRDLARFERRQPIRRTWSRAAKKRARQRRVAQRRNREVTTNSKVPVPAELAALGVTAIRVGECPGDIPWEEGTRAHSHSGYPEPGAICVADARDLWAADGSPSPTLWHEVAHVIVGDREKAGHGRLWRAEMAKRGQRILRRYR
jgi:hypothetical protein